MEEWSKKTERLLETSLQLEEELKSLTTSIKVELEDKVTDIEKDLSRNDNVLKEIQEESDRMIARHMGFSEGIQALEKKQTIKLEKVRNALEVGREEVEKSKKSLKKLRDVFAIRDDPQKLFAYPPTTFTLINFHNLKDNNDVWYSPPFYSHKCGYKMQLQVFPNGDGEGTSTHVSVKVALLPGEFDDILCWPFRGVITIHLLNQRKDQHHVVRQVWFTDLETLYMREKPAVVAEEALDERDQVARRMGEGVNQFISHAGLKENPGFFSDSEYLKNDSVLFCVWSVNVFYQHH